MVLRALETFLRFTEICVGLVWLGFELFGRGETILKSVETAVIILLYVAISIGCFAKFFGDFSKLYQNQENPSLSRVFRLISKLLTLIGRVVFEIVLIWSGVNALQRKKEREPYFLFGLAGINLILILMFLLTKQREEKKILEQAYIKTD